MDRNANRLESRGYTSSAGPLKMSVSNFSEGGKKLSLC